MDKTSIQAFFKFKKTEPAAFITNSRVLCIHCSLRQQKCRLKSTTTNGWRHFGQSEQRKSSLLFPVQSEKKSRFWPLTCDPTKKCIMPSSREKHKGMIGRGNDLRLGGLLLGIQKFFKSLSNSLISFFPSAFGIETINKSIHSSSPLENHNRLENKMGKVYTRFQTKTA